MISECRRCGVLLLHGPCRCAPFLAWCPDHDVDEDEAATVYSTDAEGAATRWLRVDDDSACEGPTRGDVIVHVRDSDGRESVWRAYAVEEVSYYARPAEVSR